MKSKIKVFITSFIMVFMTIGLSSSSAQDSDDAEKQEKDEAKKQEKIEKLGFARSIHMNSNNCREILRAQ